MIKKGVYAAGLSVINTNDTLNIEATISHASDAIKNGLHGVFFFGSTGQSQLISTSEKKDLIEQQKEVMSEAKGRGYDTRVIRKLIGMRKRDQADIAEEEAILDMYKQALGM